MDNPFSNIVPRTSDKIVNEEFLKKVSKRIASSVKLKRFIVLEGDYGSGKTLYLWNLKEKISTSKEFLKLTDNISNILKQKTPVRNKTLIIDNFDLISGLDDKKLFSLSEEFSRLIKGGMIIVIGARKDVIRRFLKINPLLRPVVNKISIPGLSYEEAKSMVVDRLNEGRPKPLKSIKPFTDDELKEIWRKSKGNPRIILMLCSWLYSQRMLLEI